MDDNMTDEQMNALEEQRQRVLNGLALFDKFMPAFSSLKPNDRSGVDRVFAVAITELEKAYCYFAIMATQAGEDGHLMFP